MVTGPRAFDHVGCNSNDRSIYFPEMGKMFSNTLFKAYISISDSARPCFLEAGWLFRAETHGSVTRVTARQIGRKQNPLRLYLTASLSGGLHERASPH